MPARYVKAVTIVILAAMVLTLAGYSAFAQQGKNYVDFAALVGGESAAASLISEAMAFFSDRLQGATVLELEAGESLQNRPAFWWRSGWIPNAVPLNRLTGDAAEKHVGSCGRFLQPLFSSAEPERVRISIVNGNACAASGLGVSFDRVAGGWRLNRESVGPVSTSTTHCGCK